MKDMTTEKVKSLLNLVPLSIEGGYFAETYRSPEMISQECLRGRYSSARSVGTAIYYLLEPGTFSEIHRVDSDEIFHFYLGDPVECCNCGRTVPASECSSALSCVPGFYRSRPEMGRRW